MQLLSVSRALTASVALTAVLAAQKPVTAGSTMAEEAVLKWFPTVFQSIEANEETHHYIGEFAFHNPHDKAILWSDFAASCACSHLEFKIGDRHYWLKTKPKEFVQIIAAPDGGEGEERIPVENLTIAPHEAGTVEVHIDLHGPTLQKSIRVDIHTTDTDAPMLKLGVDVKGVNPLVITPPEIDLGLMAPDDVREFEIEVHAKNIKDFAILSAAQMPPGMKAEFTKVDSNGIAIWRITGTYGPIKSGKGGGGVLKFATNAKTVGSFLVPVRAEVAEPISITPGFLSLGPIKSASGKKAEVRFHASNGTDLQAVSVKFANLSKPAEGVTTNVRKDGLDLIVELVVPEGAPRGLFRGDLLVELNHEKAQQRVLFNGFVR